MKRQIVITGWQSKVLTALYEEDILCELNLEPQKSRVRVGDIYIGKVKHIVQNIQAAFVEIRQLHNKRHRIPLENTIFGNHCH